MPLTPSNRRGVTLVELMIAVALIGIGTIVAAGAFRGISTSIQYSKARTLASNLAQEKMQIVMQKSYYSIFATTAPANDTNFTPNIPYDPFYFPPDTLLVGGITFTRYTYVQVVKDNGGVIQVLAPTTPDTGMRQITVSVVWQQAGYKRFHSMQSIINNPNTVMLNATIQGQVTNSLTTNPIAGALVNAAENVGWRNTADSGGNYLITLAAGTFNFAASAQGYFPKTVQVTLAANSAPVTQNFALTPISSGTLQGNVWMNTHLVVSQVVASTGPANDIEYVELYNPTTFSIFIGSNNVVNSPTYWPILTDYNNQSQQQKLFYGNSSVPSYGFFLISNTGNADPATTCSTFTVTIAGSSVPITPDACWLRVPRPNHAIECNASPCLVNGTPSSPDAGGVSLSDSQGYVVGVWPSNRIDSVAWAKSNAPAHAAPSNAVLGTGYSLPGGIQANEHLIRKSQPTGLSSGVGRAYNSMNNVNDFMEFGINFAPYATSNIYAPYAGTPAAGAIVSINDGLSSASSATLTGSPPVAQFTVPSVATGTWSVLFASGTLSTTVNLATVTANSTNLITNGSTSPAWPGPGVNSVFLSTTSRQGMISGRVTDAGGSVISPAIVVTAGGVNTTVSTTGNYTLRVGTGTFNVTANPNNTNANYQTSTRTGVVVTLGNVTSVPTFALSQGGQINGWVTSDGVNALPNVTVVALDSTGVAQDTEVSGANGNYHLINLTTGTYTIQPVLDPKQTSTPTNTSIALNTPGSTVSAGTFTVTGAMGKVTGSVKAAGQPIASGVLLIVSTMTFASPPALSSSSLTGAAYYANSSTEDGNYSIDVRGSTVTAFNVTAYYMRLNNQALTISSTTISNVTVTAGQTTPNINFSW